MLPPTLLRRLALVPLVVVIAACLVALTPLVALASWASALVRRWTGYGHRSRPLRVAWLALTWSVGEMAALTVLLCLWIVSGFGGRLDTEPYRTRHYAVMGRFLDQIYRAAERACGLRVEVAGPPDEAAGRRPPGHRAEPARGPRRLAARRPPSAHGLRSAAPGRHEGDPSAGPEPGRRGQPGAQRVPAPPPKRACALAIVSRSSRSGGWRPALASAMPSSFSPKAGTGRRCAGVGRIDRLRRQGQAELAKRAAAMPNLLPPRTGGAFAAIGACPSADVIFVAHTGLDKLVSVRDVWQSLRTDVSVHARWWRVPAAEVPRGVDHQKQTAWLFDWWERLDGWITEESGSVPTIGHRST